MLRQKLRDFYNQRIDYLANKTEKQQYLNSLYRRFYLAEKRAINDAIFQGLLPDDLAQSYLQELDEKLLFLKDT